MSFSTNTKMTAVAIVNVFETSKPFGNYGAYSVLDDGAGVSYGINQFTHRSGSLLAVIEEYLASGGIVGRSILENAVPILRRRDAIAISAVARNPAFEKALKAAAITSEMKAAQSAIAFRLYLQPAIAACDELGLKLPLSLAVVYDSMVHGSWPRLRDGVRLCRPALCGSEKQWVTAYVRKRHAWLMSVPRLAKTAYRTRFFLEQIMRGSWELDLPLRVHGVDLTEAKLFPSATPKHSSAGPATIAAETTPDRSNSAKDIDLSEASLQGRSATPSSQNAQPPNKISSNSIDNDEQPNVVDRVAESLKRAAREYDHVENLARTVATRTDAAKSLWTTIVGTIWQTVWAVIGFAYNVPRSIWFAAAILTAAFALAYLYRQIALAKIREQAELRNRNREHKTA